MNVNLRSLISKLNATYRSAMEGAAGLCVSRTHYEVDVEHLFAKLLDASNTDITRILAHFEIESEAVQRDLTRALDRMRSGSARNPALSPHLVRLLTEAWTIGSVDYGATQIRSGLLLLTAVEVDDLARVILPASPALRAISPEELHKQFLNITAGSTEDVAPIAQEARYASSEAGEPVETRTAAPGSSKTPNLDQFTINLTGAARAGNIDPVLGRDFEIRQVIDILTRRRQNNPILTGEAGVGKTAVVEGFALRIAAGDVPPSLRDVELRTLDLGLLQAGAGIKGEFENRLKSVIAEVKASPRPIILFIDEAHTMIGAGGQAGQSDAANLLKPALARGELRTIAATTWSEYKKYFEKDAALARRFQVVKVEEPSEAQAVVMMRGLVSTLEEHHGVRVLDEAVEAAVRLSHRYIIGRQLPDKCVSVLDTACARVSIGQNATPPPIEDAEREIGQLETEIRVLRRESATGAAHEERLSDLEAKKAAAETRLAELRARFDQERVLVTRIFELRQQLEAAAAARTGMVASAASTLR